jgi:hypothetical protein
LSFKNPKTFEAVLEHSTFKAVIMAAVVVCGHPTCQKAVDVDVEYHTCSLCRAPIYCSEPCRIADWVAHDCPNVVRVQGAPKAMLAPYYGQDALTEEELAALPINDPIFQSQGYLFTNDNRNVAYYSNLVEGNAISENGRMPAMRGAKPATKLTGEYAIRIKIDGDEQPFVFGNIPMDAIFKDNTSNPRANAVAGFGATFGDKIRGLTRRLHANESSYIFWPNMTDKRNENLVRTKKLSGDIQVDLLLYKEDKWQQYAHIVAGYELQREPNGFWRNIGRVARKSVEQQMRLLCPGEDVKKLQWSSYEDSLGNGIRLIWRVQGETAILKSVEFMTPVDLEPENLGASISTLPNTIEERFLCDARNLEDMVGLCMALDEHLATKSLIGGEIYDASSAEHKQLELYAGILKNHAYALQEDANAAAAAAISPQLNVAIAAAMDTLYADIGASASWWDKKAHGGYAVLEPHVTTLIAKLTALRQKVSKGLAAKVNSVRKSALVRELGTVIRIMDAKIVLLQKEGADVTNWNALRGQAASAMASQ